MLKGTLKRLPYLRAIFCMHIVRYSMILTICIGIFCLYEQFFSLSATL